MTLLLLEGAVDALSAYIQANMEAKVAELNARYGDTLLEDIKTYYDGSLPLSTPEQPSLVFHGEGWEPKEQRLANLYVSNKVTIAVFVGDDNIENRFRKLCRYALGVTELLRTAKDSIAYVVKLRAAVALTDSMSTQPFLQGMTIPVSLEQMEDY